MQGHTQTYPQLKKLAPLTTRSTNLRCVSAAEHQMAEQYSKTGKTKPLKHLPRSCLSRNTCQDSITKLLRSCSGNRAKMLLESHLGIKCHSHYNKVLRLLQHSNNFGPPIVNAGDLGCIVRSDAKKHVFFALCFLC